MNTKFISSVFICYLAASRSILNHYPGGSLTNSMSITAFNSVFHAKVAGSLQRDLHNNISKVISNKSMVLWKTLPRPLFDRLRQWDLKTIVFLSLNCDFFMNIQTENRASLCDNLLHTYLLNESS